jgi:hypothetical protein
LPTAHWIQNAGDNMKDDYSTVATNYEFTVIVYLITACKLTNSIFLNGCERKIAAVDGPHKIYNCTKRIHKHTEQRDLPNVYNLQSIEDARKITKPRVVSLAEVGRTTDTTVNVIKINGRRETLISTLNGLPN